MLNQVDLDWHSYRLLPYEQELGMREVQALTGGSPVQEGNGVRVASPPREFSILDRLTYFREARLNGTSVIVPLQGQLEATVAAKAKAATQREDVGPCLARQSTRYSAHGLHEYKGKFNPQIVRVTANLVLGCATKARILDPFCGSGTTLVEAAHSGWDSLGIDLNPLAVFISNTKLAALRLPTARLEIALGRLEQRLDAIGGDLDFQHAFSSKTLARLHQQSGAPLPNESYLAGWFCPSVLAQLRVISREIKRERDRDIRSVALIVLSDILRSVSLQDPADLRIRRRVDVEPNYPAIPIFVKELRQKIDVLVAAKEVLGTIKGSQIAVLADSRIHCPGGDGEFDAVITSPPYATALPYIDTQRLSLAFLGLLSSAQLAATERELIGNREISEVERRREEIGFAEAIAVFPTELAQLLAKAKELAGRPGNGFRRRNVPSLLLRYFRDMRAALENIRPRVRRRGTFAMIVGPNRSTLGGHELVINTPELLAALAESVGWVVHELIPLEAYQRFDLHRQNSITTEKLILLKN
jgi:site-specific DNA-methyltransferase (cytosine-N4-specific)